MSRVKYDSISELRKGKYTWNIKVRVVRKWRFSSGETTEKPNAFNLLFLDDKDSRIHAFISNDLGPVYESVFKVGKIYSVSNFTLSDYTERQKPYPIEATQQIMFSGHTAVTELDDDQKMISINAFDFYDLADLEKMANQDTYLTDVIGVVEALQPIRRFTTIKGKPSVTVKFILTDGRSKVKVTLWSDYAETFHKALTGDLERPIIIIISSAKVGYWQGVLEVSTWYSHSSVYINYNHHSVITLRKRINQPAFANYQMMTQKIIHNKIFKVCEILKLKEEYIGKKIITQLVLKKVKEISNWMIYECTSCQAESDKEKAMYVCQGCKRDVTFPDMKFRVCAISSDDTGRVALVLKDRDVQRLTNTTAYKVKDSVSFPPILKTLENLQLTVLLYISEENVKNGSNVYYAAEVAFGHDYNTSAETMDVNTNPNVAVNSSIYETGTTSSLEQVHLTNLNIISPPPVQTPASQRRRRMPSFKILSDDEE